MNVNIETLQQGANRQVIQGSEMGYFATGKSVNRACFSFIKRKDDKHLSAVI